MQHALAMGSNAALKRWERGVGHGDNASISDAKKQAAPLYPSTLTGIWTHQPVDPSPSMESMPMS